MILNNGTFTNAVFANGQKNIIIALWKDNETQTIEEIVIRPNLENIIYCKLLEQFTVDEISTMTDQRNKINRNAFEQLVKKMAIDNGLLYNESAATEQNKITVDFIFTPMDGDAGSDLLFDIKLKIFDLPEVVNSSNSELKSKLRQATTPLEALYVAGKFLYE